MQKILLIIFYLFTNCICIYKEIIKLPEFSDESLYSTIWTAKGDISYTYWFHNDRHFTCHLTLARNLDRL